MLKSKRRRKHVYEPFVLKDIKVPLAKSGLKVVDWKIVKQELEKARKEAASTKE